jgi:hypothetical protein
VLASFFATSRVPCGYLIARVDEDITMIDTTIAPRATHPLVPQLQGHLVGARARHMNYQVPLFVGTLPNNHENMMLPKSDVFMIFRNDGTSMDEKVKHWRIIVHRDGSGLLRGFGMTLQVKISEV